MWKMAATICKQDRKILLIHFKGILISSGSLSTHIILQNRNDIQNTKPPPTDLTKSNITNASGCFEENKVAVPEI